MESKFDPITYAENSTIQQYSSIDVLREYRHLVEPKRGHVILDVGCGDGYLTSNILAPTLNFNFKEMIGVDISPKMVAHAKERNNQHNIKFQVMDILTESLPYDFLERFDYCFSFYCLHFPAATPETFKAAFLNIGKMLKKNGIVFAVFPGQGPYFDTWKALYAEAKYAPHMKKTWFDFPAYLNSESRSEWCARILRNTGFKINICEGLQKTFRYDGVAKAVDTMNAINNYVMPEDLKADFRADMTAEMEKRGTTFEDGNGKTFYSFDYELLFVHATKQ